MPYFKEKRTFNSHKLISDILDDTKFTKVEETEDRVSFLNVSVTRTNTESVEIQLYKKQSHTN